MDNIEAQNNCCFTTKESGHNLAPVIGQTITRSDLRNTKRELFSKLIENQSQQMIVTISNSASRAENLDNNNINRASSSTTTLTKQTANDQQFPSVRQPQNKRQQLFTEDFKREPIVFSRSISRWYINDEVASILTNFSAHPEWQTNELKVRPKSGAVFLYSREKVRYRQDGYCWKKRKNGRTTREDHMKLKVQGIECIYGCYVHSAILPTFHRRCYWLLENPDIVLVHYLNQPPDDQNKMMITLNSSSLEADTRRRWTNEEIIEEIGSVFGGISQIKHTLNINFPPPVAMTNHIQLTQENRSESEGTDSDKMTDTSSQSFLSQTTFNSDILQDHIDIKVIDEQQKGVGETFYLEEKLMSTIRPDESSQIQDNPNCDANQINGHNSAANMSFNTINGNGGNSDSCQQNAICCFGYTDSTNIDVSTDIMSENNTSIINQDSSSRHIFSERMERNLCSPVTQIYNKIVDDIETYALPLESSQFNETSHHTHKLPISLLPDQNVVIGEGKRSNQEHQVNEVIQSMNIDQQFNNRSCESTQRNQRCEIKQEQSNSCPMILSSRDPFGNQLDRIVGRANDQNENRDRDSLLMVEFNLQSGSQVNDDLSGSVVESMANVDDLRDLIMGISPCEDADLANNLLVDTTSLDLFNFKSDCE